MDTADAPAPTMTQDDLDILIQTGAWKDHYPAPEPPIGPAEKIRRDRIETERLADRPGDVLSQKATAQAAARVAAEAYAADPMDGDKAAAYIDAMTAAQDAADVLHRIVKFRADQSLALAVRQAGDDPVARERARARAMQEHAASVGEAEAELEEARLARDRAVVDVARHCKIQAHRVRAAEARLAEMRKAETDVLRLTNPYADPVRPKITQSQFNSIRDPDLRARAAREADIVPDDDPEFTKKDALDVLRSRGSAGRTVLTRDEFEALPAEEKARAARTAILI